MNQVADRPPYVVFEYRPVEDRARSVAEGHYVAKDVAFVLVTRPGSKDTHVEEAASWISKLKERARQGQIPETWATAFEEKFKSWLKGEEVPLNGTPIKTWPVISPSASKAIIQAGFLTVEDLAQAADSEVSSIGTGAISYKQKAIHWLEQASSSGKIVERLSALEAQLSDLLRTNAELVKENSALKIKAGVKTAEPA
jgi:hypothetical protein